MSTINTKCYEAFNYGRREEALRLLKQVKDARTVKSKNNFTILHCAAYHGWLDVVKQLINEHQFDPDCKDNDGNTPLSKARGNGKQSVVDYLETANIDAKCYDAFNYGRREEALRLLKQVKDPHAVKSKENFNILHCAAYHGWLDVVKELINDYDFDPDCEDDSGNTPLSKAKSNGKQAVVDYLETVRGGVDTKCYDAFNRGRKDEALTLLKQVKDPRTVKSNNNFTILHCAAYHGWLAVVKQLINDHEFNPDCMDDDGNTPLSKAKSNGKQPVVDYLETAIEKKCYDAFNKGRREEALRLLKQVKDPRTVMSNNNFTLLHCAAYHGWLPVVKQLIIDHDFDPDCQDNDGNTPLSKARSNGKQPVVDYLEKALGTGTNSGIERQSSKVDDQCFEAFNYGKKEEALRLLKKIDDPRTVKDSNDFTLLHCAAYHGWLSVVKELIKDHQFNPDCMDDDGNTPLMKAKSNGKQPVVDYLETVIEKRCYDAFEKGRREEASRLLKQVKDPRTVMSNHNFTLLHCAAYHGWLAVVKELINVHKCDPDCMDDDGITPLSKARGSGKQPVVDYLERVVGLAPTSPPTKSVPEETPRPSRGYSREEETDSPVSSIKSNTSVTSSVGSGNKRYRDLLMKSPELDDVFPLMTKLSSSWHDIGGRLRVPIGERQSLLQVTNMSNDGKLERILDIWISSQPSDVTWKMIIDMLIAFEKKNIASEVARFLDKQHIYEKYIQQDDFVPFCL